MNPPSSLCPGYRHVDAFGSDDEYEDEEEVCYVTLDLGSIEPTLVPSSSTYRLIGLDTPTPFLQLSGTILKGRHETLLGTELIFTDAKDPSDVQHHKKAVTHVASTEQRVCFREVRLQPKGTAYPATMRGKGKSREMNVEPTGDLPMEVEAAAIMVDRVTGKSAPRARTLKKQARSKKAKGKAKERGEQEQDVRDVDMDADMGDGIP
ncbi:hypothetical protein H0H81_011321 [Sphagnurus paluster]|uniref:Transcription factor TFIIIC triple barrel domain-containing protein n=1 Tax=Sphagnurus paluster TaxID=117069 RepID=A0A9P7KKK6_9AGAR|nr:hypothetical protein H0H81_011321 [Sphagnurus paluster]